METPSARNTDVTPLIVNPSFTATVTTAKASASVASGMEQRRELDMSANKCFMFFFIVIINMTGLLLGYAMAYSNQVTALLNAKLGYDADTAAYMQAYIGSSVVLGMTIGAVSGGVIMKIGRRKALILASAYGIAGNLLTYHLNIYFLIIGRFLFGFSVGIFSSVCPKYMEETIPAHLYDTLAIIYNTS